MGKVCGCQPQCPSWPGIIHRQTHPGQCQFLANRTAAGGRLSVRLSHLGELCLGARNIQHPTHYTLYRRAFSQSFLSPFCLPQQPLNTPSPLYQHPPHPWQNCRRDPGDNASDRAPTHKEWQPWSAPLTTEPLVPTPP